MSSAEKPVLDSARDWIKYHLIPVNNLILFTGFLIAALDTAAPIARPYTKILTTMAAAGAVLLVLTSVLPLKSLQAFLREKRWTLWLGFLVAFACAGFVSVAHGDQGVLASKFPKLADLQSSFFDLDAKVTAIQQTTTEIRADTQILRKESEAAKLAQESVLGETKDIKQAVRATAQRVETTEKIAAAMRTETAAIRQQLEDPAPFEADRCPDIRCAVAMGASRKALQRFLDSGVRLPPDILGAALTRLVESRNKNRLDVVDLYLSSGALRDINEPSLQVMWGGSSPMAKVVGAPGVPVEVGTHGCFLGKLRLLELAALAGDTEFRGWLLQRGANPHLENTWCVGPGAPAIAFSVASLGKDFGVLSRLGR